MHLPRKRSRYRRSAYFTNLVGDIRSASAWPLEDLIFKPDQYSYEGYWLFGVLTGVDILGMRIGFSRGTFDWTDYGTLEWLAASNSLFYNLELLTPDGIVASLVSGRYPASAVRCSPGRVEFVLQEGGVELFRISGWPRMEWNFPSPDHQASVQLHVVPQQIVAWPDSILPHNTFSMWLASCQVNGTVRLGNRSFEVSGRASCDHPRTVLQRNDVPSFGWYLFTPVFLDNGASALSYYAEDGQARKDEEYSVGMLATGKSRTLWLYSSEIMRLEFDDEGQPRSWHADLTGENAWLSYDAKVKDMRVVATPGCTSGPPIGKKYTANPLLFTAEGEYSVAGQRKRLNGVGLGEFLIKSGSPLPSK